jgi:hypothetical protein
VLPRTLLALALASALACDGSTMMMMPAEDAGAGDGGASDAGASTAPLTYTFPSISVGPYEEISWRCQSWTLDNDEPIYYRQVRAENEGAWHHSNWFFVPEDTFDGPDGTWGCSERGFDEITAGVVGGVLFAQSTQALSDVQAFPPGAAVRIPPRSRIVGDVHLINLEAAGISSAMRFTIDTVPADEVETHLVPMSFTNLALAIPPRSESLWAMDCDYSAVAGTTPFDFRIYYALPHFHGLGTYFKLEAFGGPSGPLTIVEDTPLQGDSWSITLDPPVDVSGHDTIRFTCGYDNPRDDVVRYGIGDQEMCVFLAYTDASYKFAGSADASAPMGDMGGIPFNLANCRTFAFPADL